MREMAQKIREHLETVILPFWKGLINERHADEAGALVLTLQNARESARPDGPKAGCWFSRLT